MIRKKAWQILGNRHFCLSVLSFNRVLANRRLRPVIAGRIVDSRNRDKARCLRLLHRYGKGSVLCFNAHFILHLYKLLNTSILQGVVVNNIQAMRSNSFVYKIITRVTGTEFSKFEKWILQQPPRVFQGSGDIYSMMLPDKASERSIFQTIFTHAATNRSDITNARVIDAKGAVPWSPELIKPNTEHQLIRDPRTQELTVFQNPAATRFMMLLSNATKGRSFSTLDSLALKTNPSIGASRRLFGQTVPIPATHTISEVSDGKVTDIRNATQRNLQTNLTIIGHRSIRNPVLQRIKEYQRSSTIQSTKPLGKTIKEHLPPASRSVTSETIWSYEVSARLAKRKMLNHTSSLSYKTSVEGIPDSDLIVVPQGAKKNIAMSEIQLSYATPKYNGMQSDNAVDKSKMPLMQSYVTNSSPNLINNIAQARTGSEGSNHSIDITLLADNVYRIIEDKLRIERERRGIFR